MKFIEYKHTLALYHKIKEDLNKIGFIITIIVQIFLFFYYSYSIYVHHLSIIYTVLYSILLTISILVFIEECIFQYKKRKEKNEELKIDHKKKRSVLKIISLISKISLLIISLIPIIQNKVSDFDKVMTLALAILLVFQFSFIFISFELNKYLNWVKKALELDYRESSFIVKGANKSFSDKLHNFANSLKEENEDTEFLNVINDQLAIDEEERKDRKEKEKIERKKQRSEDISTIKEHFKNKFISKKISDDKIINSYKKEQQIAKQLISNQKNYDKFLNEFNKKIDSDKIPDEINYLKEFPSLLNSSNITNDEKEMMMIEMHYFLHPLVSNAVSTEDNLKIHNINQERKQGN